MKNVVWFASILLTGLLLGLLVSSSVAAARCQISNVSYAYPRQANPNEEIQVDTTVAGSCASTGLDYYSVRVDLVDMNSNYVSSSSTPIGYSATNFTVVAINSVTTPSSNGTWPLGIHVYVIRAGGTNGFYLFDYQRVSNATIQVGSATPVPEFNLGLGIIVFAALSAGIIIVRTRRRVII
ncbi:MAG: hypothetical protein ABSA50_08430 [Candidatus Bathyarchaeia archaeon]|jgi:hypothetical protein